MTSRAVEAPAPPPPRCRGAPQPGNGTCAEQLSLLAPLSSTLALLVLVAVLAGVVLVSLATFHFHKRKLRNRKIRRAQEEFERDSLSPARAGEPARPRVIVRAAAHSEKPASRAADGDDAQTVHPDF